MKLSTTAIANYANEGNTYGRHTQSATAIDTCGPENADKACAEWRGAGSSSRRGKDEGWKRSTELLRIRVLVKAILILVAL